MSERGQPRIVCAANRLTNGKIIIGARHWDEMMHQACNDYLHRHDEVIDRERLEVQLIDGEEQGFIDQFGTFYDRQEAWKIAERNGQILHRCGGDTTNGGTLFSENLY